MPKLGELLYVGALAGGNEISAKIIHFTFGILSSIFVYKIARRYASPTLSLLAIVIFYSNIVVAWESTTAYVDLIRTFFETVSLYTFLNWYQTQRRKWFVFTAIFVGLAIATKLIALGSFLIFTILILFVLRKNIISLLRHVIGFFVIAMFIPLPWFLFSLLYTGSPIYPFLTGIYPATLPVFTVVTFFIDVWNILLNAADPISPIYLILVPFIVVLFSKFQIEFRLIVYYCLLAIIVWYFTPHTGGGRFLLPYLPAFSVLSATTIAILSQQKSKFFYKLLITVVIFISLITIGYRSITSLRYIPYVLGKETKQEFLSNNLNFMFGDFYDVDNYFANNIASKGTVLLYGFHNLYYVDFPFIDASWVQKGDQFGYIATQNTNLPSRFSNWSLIYTNNKTLVKLYKPPTDNACIPVCRY